MRCRKTVVLSPLSETVCMRLPGHTGECSPKLEPDPVTDVMVLAHMRELWQQAAQARAKRETQNGPHQGTE